MINIKRLVQNFTGYWIYKSKYLPRGTDLFWDIKRVYGQEALRLVLDIGANVGQFTHQVLRHSNTARVHCFEPVAETYAQLAAAMGNYKGVHCHKLALSTEGCEKIVFVNPDSTESSLNYAYGDFTEELVKVVSLDDFCAENAIDFVDLVKVDTEGSDLDVLRGATRMLEKEAINFLLIETELLQTERHFIPLADLAEFLGCFGYEIISLYDQRNHWDGRLGLSFCNVLFGSAKVVNKALSPNAD